MQGKHGQDELNSDFSHEWLELCMDSLQSFLQTSAHRDGDLCVPFSSNFQTLSLISASSNNFPLTTCLLLHYHEMTQKVHISSSPAEASQAFSSPRSGKDEQPARSAGGIGSSEPRGPEPAHRNHAMLWVGGLRFRPFFHLTMLVAIISLRNQFGKAGFEKKQIKFCY